MVMASKEWFSVCCRGSLTYRMDQTYQLVHISCIPHPGTCTEAENKTMN